MSNETEKLINSDVYQYANVEDQIQMLLELRHFSLESGADAQVEIFKLFPVLYKEVVRLRFIVDNGLGAEDLIDDKEPMR